MPNLSIAQIITQLQLKLVPDDADSALVIPERHQNGAVIPALLAWTTVDEDGPTRERYGHACVIEEPEERAIALTEASHEHSGVFTEDGYPMKQLPYSAPVREALRRAAQAVLVLG